jgi:hypothetical protein
MKRERRERRAVETLFKELVGAPRKKFPRSAVELNASRRRGLYVIYDRRGRVAHVGRTPKAKDGIVQRLRNHMRGQSSFVAHHLKGDGSRLWRDKFEFRWIVVRGGRYPFGHRWSVATHVRDVTPAQMKEAMQAMSHGKEAGTSARGI